MNDTGDKPPARRKRFRADFLLLLLVAVVWGSALAGQRFSMEQVGPFTFNAARFAIGALTLIPIMGWHRLRSVPRSEVQFGALLGVLLFAAASLHQIGLIWSTAGKAGFVTGLYVVIVPLLLGMVWQEWSGWTRWLGAGLATTGLFLLSLQGNLVTGVPFRLAAGDAWVLGSAFVWALHVIAIGLIAPGRDPLRLAVVRFCVCSLLSIPMTLLLEPRTWPGLLLAMPAILYTGTMSTGLGYTGQMVAQRHTKPTHAASILSTESVFAVCLVGSC